MARLFKRSITQLQYAVTGRAKGNTELDEERRFFDGDIWPYGLEQNRHVLEALTRYSYEQGLSQRHLRLEELFAKSTWEEAKI